MKIENLHFSYGDHEVLKGVSYDAQLGEFISVLGPTAWERVRCSGVCWDFWSPQAEA